MKIRARGGQERGQSWNRPLRLTDCRQVPSLALSCDTPTFDFLDDFSRNEDWGHLCHQNKELFLLRVTELHVSESCSFIALNGRRHLEVNTERNRHVLDKALVPGPLPCWPWKPLVPSPVTTTSHTFASLLIKNQGDIQLLNYYVVYLKLI